MIKKLRYPKHGHFKIDFKRGFLPTKRTKKGKWIDVDGTDQPEVGKFSDNIGKFSDYI